MSSSSGGSGKDYTFLIPLSPGSDLSLDLSSMHIMQYFERDLSAVLIPALLKDEINCWSSYLLWINDYLWGKIKLQMGSHLVQESAPQWNDYYLVFYFSLAFPIIRLLLDVHIYQRLARWLIYPTDEKQLRVFLKNGPNKKMFKTTESMWKLSYYAVSEAFALFVIYKEPWFTSTRAFWDSWQVQTLKFQLKLFYMYQCGFYVYSVAALLVWETRRKDFVVMLSHHVVTIGLISTSYILGFFRVGSVILALHDASDVFLESAKLFKYAGNEVGASIVFGLFVLSWLLLRLIYFPFWIIRSTSYEAVEFMDLTQSDIRCIYYYFNTLLITLLIMHIYWWVLISRMVFRQLENKGKVGDDVRSDSEDD